MHNKFIRTENVKKLISMMNNLQHRAEGVPGLGLVYGEPGLGKTYSIMWWAMQNDAVYIRCTNTMTTKWLLEELAEELGEIPYSKTPDIFNQVIAQLIKEPRILIVDEIDYLTTESRAVETLRDIHDKTDIPILFVGMGSANHRLMRFKHLYDRISEILKFEPFSKQEISKIIDELSEIELTDCAKNLIFTKTKRFRQIVKLINKAEQIAKANGISSIDETTLKEFINGEITNQDFDFDYENTEIG